MYDAKQVYITLTAVNEAAPVLPTLAAQTVDEDEGLPYVVTTITSTDADSAASPQGVVRYSITGGNSENKFLIDEQTGELTLVGTLNRETTDTYTLTIKGIYILLNLNFSIYYS